MIVHIKEYKNFRKFLEDVENHFRLGLSMKSFRYWKRRSELIISFDHARLMKRVTLFQVKKAKKLCSKYIFEEIDQ